MLSLHNQKSIVIKIFPKNLISGIISRRKSIIVAEDDFYESIEIDELQVDKIDLTLFCNLTRTS
jgi:hypothetical protein